MNLIIRLLYLTMLLSFSAHAQHASQPMKESTDDLRSGLIMFSIEDLKRGTTLWLERTANLDYFLRWKDKKDEKIIKVAGRDAKQFDREFASKFLKCQYELPSSSEGCKVTLRLIMKGERQDICEKDEKKAQEILPLAQKLETRF
jgi:hypothetical protein